MMPMKVMPLRSVQPCLRFEVVCICTEVQNEGSVSVCCPQVKRGFEFLCGYTKVQRGLCSL